MTLIYCLAQNSCVSQNTILAEANTQHDIKYLIQGDFKILEMDNLGDLYLIDQKNQLSKFNIDGQVKFEFSIKGLGDISSIDVSNPQKILLYFPQYQNIIFLDNTLSEIKRLNLEELNYWDIQGVANSRDNNIWIHDPVNNRLLKINSEGAIQLSSNEVFNSKIEEIGSSRIYERNNRVFLYYENIIYEFDSFGQLIQTFMLTNQGIQFESESLFFLDQDQISMMDYQVHFTAEDQFKKIYDTIKIRDFVVAQSELWIIDDKGLFKI